MVHREPRNGPVEARLRQYLRRGGRVHGWLDPYSAAVIATLSRLQIEQGITGSVGEIGVHMGRLFILLKLTTRESERCFAVDVFDRQDLNTDRSGSGDRQRFLRNIEAWTGDADVSIIARSSLDVTSDDIRNQVGPCRLVSIDGGHTEQCADHDLHLTEGVLVDDGVAILDDFFNQSWPGVAAGASRYFLERDSGLKPFAVSPMKLYLARAPHHEFYRRQMRTCHAGELEKSVEMFGHVVDVYGCNPGMRSVAARLRRRLGRTSIGPFLKTVRDRLVHAHLS